MRGDRALGLALYQYDIVNSFNEYDLEVNTERLSPIECADKILRFINHGLSDSVFKKLSRTNPTIKNAALNFRSDYANMPVLTDS
ncbi:hypothetical protein MKX42_23815 [Paenibacillus sp. FSL R7-0204]|uniref:phosphotransferase-like protein n=1 Tax=Paenibacillus sp. FSL R7-0204 TaxID=2921675 RepID=UPI0030F5E4BE